MKTSATLIAVLLLFSLSCKKDKQTTYQTLDLLSHFKFDNDLTDAQGYSKDGSKGGNPLFVNGKIGKAISFNGVDQGISFLPKVAAAYPQITFSCWLKSDDMADSKLFVYVEDNNAKRLYVVSGPNSIAFGIADPAFVSATASVTTGTWAHIAGTYDGADIKLYVNGVLKQTVNHPGDFAGFGNGMALGAGANAFWKGTIDEIFIYHRALSAEEIKALYQYGL